MDSLDVESKKTARVDTEVSLSDSNKKGESAKINAQATANYISIMSRQKGLLAESSQRTLTVLSSNLNTYLKDAGALDAVKDDRDSAQLGHYRKLTVQVINRDQSLQEKVAQDLSTSGQLVRSRDAATTLEKNLKNLPPSLNEGTPAGKNLNKLICQSVVNLTDYENMGAGLQRDLSIREVYPPQTTLSLRSKIATQDALTASIAYVKSNQPEVLATLKNSLEVVKTKPGTSTPQIMTRYLRKALDEFPDDSTYLDIFKQNKQKVDEGKEYQDEISKNTAKRIQTLIHKAADTARRGNLLPENRIEGRPQQPLVEAKTQTALQESAPLKDASTLTLSELSDRAAKLQQKFREDRIRMAQEGKLPDPANRNTPVSKADVQRLDSEIDGAIKSGDMGQQSARTRVKSETLTPEDVKKVALEAIREVLKETAKAQLEMTQNAAKETATQVAEVLKESVRSQLEATQNNALMSTNKAIEELKATVRSELEANHNNTRETTDKVMAELRESVKNELEASKNSNLENTSKVVAELKDAVKNQLEASKSSLESTTKVVEELKETVRKELESSKTSTLESTSKVVAELRETVKQELESSKNNSFESTSKVLEELKNTVQKQLELSKNSNLENTAKVVEELKDTVKKQLEATKTTSLENTSKVVEELKDTVQKQLEANKANSILNTNKVLEDLKETVKRELEANKNNSLVNTSKIVEDLKETVKNHLEITKASAQEVASQVAEELRKTVKSQLESQENANRMNVDKMAEDLKNSVKAQLELSQSTTKDMTDRALKDLIASLKSETAVSRETPLSRNSALDFVALNQNDDTDWSKSSSDPLKFTKNPETSALNTSVRADMVREQTLAKVTENLNAAARATPQFLETPLVQADDDNPLVQSEEALTAKPKVLSESSFSEEAEVTNNSAQGDSKVPKELHETIKNAEEQDLKQAESRAASALKAAESQVYETKVSEQKVPPQVTGEPKAALQSEAILKDEAKTHITYKSEESMAAREAEMERHIANQPKAYPKETVPRTDSMPSKDGATGVATLVQNDSLNAKDNVTRDSAEGTSGKESAESAKSNTIISRTLPEAPKTAVPESSTGTMDADSSLADSIPTEVLLRDTSDEAANETVNQFASRFTTASGIGVTTPVVPGSTTSQGVAENTQSVAANTISAQPTLEEEALAESQKQQQNRADSTKTPSVNDSTAADDTPISNPENDSFENILKTGGKSEGSESAAKPRTSVLEGFTSTSGADIQAIKSSTPENANAIRTPQEQNLGQRILAETIPEDELSDSVIPKDVKDQKLIKENRELTQGEKKDGIAISAIPNKTPGAAAITKGQSEPIPEQTVVDGHTETKDKSGLFSKIASFFSKKSEAQNTENTERGITMRESNSASANLMALATKDSPLNALTHSLKVQMNNPNLPSLLRDQAKDFLRQLENPINDLPSVQNWLSFTSSPMSPSSSMAIALHQWAFTLLSIRFSQLGKSVDKFLKKKISLYDDLFDDELKSMQKKLKDGSRGSVSGLLNDTMDQIQRFQKPQKEELPTLYQYVPLPPARDGGHEGAFNARPVIEEDGIKSWHLTFVFDLEKIGPIEIKAVAKFPEVRLNVVTSTFEGLKKIQECMPHLREELQQAGLTTTNASARLGTVHFRDEVVTPQTDGKPNRDDENFSVDI